jgi:uncharacterized protein YcfL
MRKIIAIALLSLTLAGCGGAPPEKSPEEVQRIINNDDCALSKIYHYQNTLHDCD